MIGKISAPRGERVEPLIYYLYGPGRREEHTDPHIVAGWRHPAELEPPLREDGRRDFRRLSGLLNQPHAAMGKWGFAPAGVALLDARRAAEDKVLSDDEWAQIAHDVMHRTGLAPFGEEDDAVRWVAVWHGDDHIHVVAMLARQDRRRVRLSYERRSVRAACLAAEERYGLESTAPADRTAAPPSVPRRDRQGRPPRPGRAPAHHAAPPRHHRRRRCGQRAGVLRSPRPCRGPGPAAVQREDPGQVTGYAVALPGDTAKDSGPVWYSGGKLAPDLTWPKLRQRWTGPGTASGDPFTAAERNAIWEHAARATEDAAARIRLLADTDPAAATDAAWAASDTLHVAAAALGSRILRQAADAYDRAARPPYARIPSPTPAGNQLRRAARLITAFAYLANDPSLTPIVLLTRLAALAEAVAGLRESQRHAVQAASALHAARHLHAAAGTPAARTDRQRAPAPNPAALAGASFPQPARPPRPDSPAPSPARPGPRTPAPSPRRRRRR